MWRDETGVIATTDLALLTTIVVIGLIVGLASFRDQVVQEFADIASGVATLNQSFSYAGTVITLNGQSASIAGSQFIDGTDSCDQGENMAANSVCVDVASVQASHEG
jgi:hypothetical protein